MEPGVNVAASASIVQKEVMSRNKQTKDTTLDQKEWMTIKNTLNNCANKETTAHKEGSRNVEKDITVHRVAAEE